MSQEQAAAWKNWQQNPCWQELLSIADDIKKRSVRDQDSITTSDLSIAVVAEKRGIRKGLEDLFRKVEEIVHQESS